MGMTDAELIARWQRGDLSAFEALVRRWQDAVARMLARLVGRDDLVPDLCQDVFLRVFQAGAKYREEGTFRSWLYRIALNVARDVGRRRGRFVVSDNGREMPAPGPPAEVQCENRERIRQIDAAIQALPAAEREVLVLRHYEQLSFEEMARMTGTPASTLKSRFSKALTRLRERLRQWE